MIVGHHLDDNLALVLLDVQAAGVALHVHVFAEAAFQLAGQRRLQQAEALLSQIDQMIESLESKRNFYN
jgi:hypothetical protein